MTPFESASAITPGPDGFVAEIPDGWQQGRGAFGGLVVAVLLRAATAVEAERPVRSLTSELVAPVLPGPARITVETLRRGSGATTLDVRLFQGELASHATVVLAKGRAVGREWAAPRVPPPTAAMTIPNGTLPPAFARHFEYSPTGPLPFSGGSDPVVEGWVALREPCALDVALLAALADAYWPTSFSRVSAPHPSATLTFSLQVVAVPDDPGPFWYRARGVSARDGYLVEHRELYSSAGELLAFNAQTFAMLG